ncbi:MULTISPECIES: tyrosine-protein phosphatase [Mammaliicoccus]|uniref:Tyrosine-protein phosphatase n=1 Tax=Mammaliicoccus fleurettii TaxID=150056 RepID=A0ABS5MNX8_9STAP|nr:MULTISPECIES: CpsB/CapC family capsule biosynthesis tyrosine phosphatase [Mammaliicoccus]HCN61644.1 capsular biosynthesis protein [Staphylococcus sp.]MBL0848450.1 capsular biosynthesis protein [Mammaliicoccus fleurettii]MBS3671924.1 capsular biosynthesis protein [Mammaliicoccus fleurettii]MBS3697621.1 capsular biosynthesis protein [Mammaliicoccus fleurettii]MEB7725159.1 capsular biosynthesis protein [Mammaliicoccus fleurettii]
MIDIHNHLLVGMDDGPQTLEETIDLLTQAKEQGITGIVVTPHHLHPRYNNIFSDVDNAIKDLTSNQQIKDFNIQLYPGQEIRITDKVLEDIDQHQIQGINHSKYLLIELPSNSMPHYTKNLLYEIQTKGFIPVIAHPERNKAIAQDINLLYELTNNGALSQVTASSLTGELGKNLQKLSIQMIEHNLIHFVASDAHHSKNRPFGLGELFNTSKLKNMEPTIKGLLNNNEAMIQNKDVVKERPIEFKKSKFFGLF